MIKQADYSSQSCLFRLIFQKAKGENPMTLPDWVVLITASVSAVATGFIAAYAYKSHTLAKAIRESAQQHQDGVNDLYQAIVIATLLSGPGSTGRLDDVILFFKKHYKGATKIFE